MQKSKSKTQKKSVKGINKKNKKNEILDELAAKLREIEDNELAGEEFVEEEEQETQKSDEGEEEGEDSENLNLDFSQFTPSLEIPETGAPVLERIAGAQARPIFVGGIPQTQTIPGEEKESDEFKYVAGREGAGEPKYIESDSRISREPERVDFTRAGREPAQIFPQINPQAFFEQATEEKNLQSSNVERTWRAERFDVERAGREEPLRKQETKYEKYRPKTPKSY
jgi:hypothetical protein